MPLLVLAAGYLLLVLLLYLAQERLIFPGRRTCGRPCARIEFEPAVQWAGVRQGSSDVALHRLTTARGERVAALYGRAAAKPEGEGFGERRPAILFFYGNGTSLATTRRVFDDLRRLGAHVLVPEYCGYGLSEGTASEAGCYATADAAWEFLLSRPEVDPERIVVVGYSLGGAVAIDLAARRPVAGLATLNTFTSMAAMARRCAPLFPGPWLLRHRFDSLGKIRRVRCPVLLVHGERDTLVPPAMCDALAAAAAGPVTRLLVPGAGHADLFEVGGEVVWSALERLVFGTSRSAGGGKRGASR